MERTNAHAAAFAAVIGLGRFGAPFETPELSKELALLRRQIRADAPDRTLVRTIRRITALRLRASRAARRWSQGVPAPSIPELRR